MKYTHDDNFVNLDDEFDESDRFQEPIEKDKKEVRKKVWRRTGNGQWEGERGLDLRENEDFNGAGLYLSKRRSGKRLTGFEEADLIRAYRAGDKSAGDRLIESLMWLVRGIAGNQRERGKLKYGRAFYGPSFDDKVAAGIAGLVSAIEKYNLSHNTQLSTYARWWIMKSIGEECERWRYRGMGGQTRADRVLFSHTALTAEELAGKAKCSLKQRPQLTGSTLKSCPTIPRRAAAMTLAAKVYAAEIPLPGLRKRNRSPSQKSIAPAKFILAGMSSQMRTGKPLRRPVAGSGAVRTFTTKQFPISVTAGKAISITPGIGAPTN